MAQNRYYSSTAQKTTTTDNPLGAGATTIHVASAAGFPASTPFTLILERDTANEEVVTVTAVAGTTLTVTRGQDSTAAIQHSFGATVEHGVSARDFDEPQAHIAATAAHGATGAVVGTTNTQTLSGKTLSSPVLNTPTVNGSGGALALPAGPDTLVGRATTDTLTNKTLTQPTIADFTNAGHSHANAAGGGQLAQANTHGTPDTDVATTSLHHTIGTSATQAAAGNHAHTNPTDITDTGWTSYTPTWTAATSGTPTVGNGTLVGRYKKIGKTVFFQIEMAVGLSGFSFGVGNWSFSLPVQVSASAVTGMAMTKMIDASANATYTGLSTIGASGSSISPRATPYGGTELVADTGQPFAWATNDVLRITGFYESV